MNGDPRDPRAPGALRSAPSNDNMRTRNKRRDDAIRKKVEQELSRRTKKRGSTGSAGAARQDARRSRAGTVSSLRPAPAIIIIETARIIQAAQLMAAKRADAVLVVNEDGALAGILTDKDIAYRVVAEGLDVRTTPVSAVMTPDPIAVYDKGSRNEALNIMVSRRFRHLPVISEGDDAGDDEGDDDDGNGGGGGGGTSVVGLLDITKCVFERLDDLERKVNEDQNIINAIEALERRGAVGADQVGAVRQQHGCPDVGFLIAQNNAVNDESDFVPEVSIKASVRDAARMMKSHHGTAVLVVGAQDEEKIGGIFTTKDIVLRVIAASLDPNTTSVVRVMTPHPDFVGPDTSILEALKKLHVGRYLHLPVMDGTTPIGLVDVLTLTISMLTYLMNNYVSAVQQQQPDGSAANPGEDGPMWNKFWNSTFAAGSTVESESDRLSQTSESRAAPSTVSAAQGYHQQQQQQQPQHSLHRLTPTLGASGRNSASRHPLSPQADDFAGSMLSRSQNMITEDPTVFAFKLRDMTRSGNGKVYRFSSHHNSLAEMYAQICAKTGARSDLLDAGAQGLSTASLSSDLVDIETALGEVVRVCYIDDEGDVVHIESDKDLEEAVAMSRRVGWNRLMVYLGEPMASAVPDLGQSRHSSGASSPTPHSPRGPNISITHNDAPAPAPAPAPTHTYTNNSGPNGNSFAHGPAPPRRDEPQGLIDFLKDAPLPVNIAISAGIVLIASYLVVKLNR
ncbi:hypothetical protein BC831DRAFT_460579 [Entophlyctis helioformis]|nr:hypothetical protein BC831DRAFT_460579 [Entophlyctis helioformis]